ncbi:MAG: hypothetical protein WD875_19290 [Pirellulales bacterium]
MLHFVVGPVSAGKLLDEAAWAHRVFDAARVRTPDEMTSAQANKTARNQIEAVRREHMEMIAGDAAGVVRQMAASRAAYAKMQRASSTYGPSPYRQASCGRSSNGRTTAEKTPTERWEPLIWSMGGSNEERVHRLLAFDPLPPLSAVDATVFRQLAGQTVNDRDGSITKAMSEVQRAEKSGRPVMFVFYRHWDSWRMSRERKMLGQAPLDKLIGQFAVINLPLKEQPALSAQLLDFELPAVGENANVQVVLADCRLKQFSAASDRIEPQAFAATLRRAIAENQLAFAAQLVEKERPKDAKRVLYKARRCDDRGVAARADAMLTTLLAKNE